MRVHFTYQDGSGEMVTIPLDQEHKYSKPPFDYEGRRVIHVSMSKSEPLRIRQYEEEEERRFRKAVEYQVRIFLDSLKTAQSEPVVVTPFLAHLMAEQPFASAADHSSPRPSMATFVPYPRIYNAPPVGLKPIHETVWVAMEKIHGANFGITFHPASGEIRYQTRNVLLARDADFMGALSSKDVALVASKMPQLEARLSVEAQITIFGEVFGKRIQKELTYDPKEIHFVAFDICVDGTFLTHHEVATHCAALGIPMASTLILGTFNEIRAGLDVESLASAHSTLGEIAEGYVMRPLDESGMENVYKVKRRAFREKAPKPVPANASELERIKADIEAHLTPARLATVRSKLGADASIEARARALIEDAMDDFLEQEDRTLPECWEKLPQVDKTRIRKVTTTAAFKLVRAEQD